MFPRRRQAKGTHKTDQKMPREDEPWVLPYSSICRLVASVILSMRRKLAVWTLATWTHGFGGQMDFSLYSWPPPGSGKVEGRRESQDAGVLPDSDSRSANRM